MIAKKRSMLRAVHELLRQGAVDKRYLALVSGRWPAGETRVDAPLRKNVLRSGERVVRVSDDGKPSLSIFRPVTVYRDASLVEVKLETGRTHQVRVHAACQGHPIAGDAKYGDEPFDRRMRELGLKRLFLHARTLAFTVPGTGQRVEVTAPLPSDLKALLNKLEQSDGS